MQRCNNNLKFNNMTKIIDGAFSNRRLENVTIPSNIFSIGNFSFINCDMMKLTIEDGVNSIGKNAFSYNNLNNITIPGSVDIIGESAFSNNLICNLCLEGGIKKIEKGAFSNNKLTLVTIPISVKYIGDNAFNNIDVIYDGIKIDKELISKYGTSSIIRLYKIIKYSDINLLKKLPMEVILKMPLEQESIKDIKENYKPYLDIKKYFNKYNKNVDNESLFKICYILGLFKKNDDKTINLIKCFINKLCDDGTDINKSLCNIKLTKYKPNVRNILLDLYLADNLYVNNELLIKDIYELYESIKASALKKKKDDIRKKYEQIKRMNANFYDTSLLKKELGDMIKEQDEISYVDICNYLNKTKLKIKDGNEELESIVDELSNYMTSKEFDKFQEMYEKSHFVKKTIPLVKDSNKKGITYYLAKSDDPINIIVPYYLKTCARLGGIGFDITRQTMLNSDIVNLIILNEDKKLIGKATAYYNQDKKYVLFNNISVKGIKTKNLEYKNAKEKEVLDTLLRATKEIVGAYRKKDVQINSVRIGMNRNSLSDTIKNSNIKIEYDNLISNYNYKNYEGDANSTDGQAILYEDSEKCENSLAKLK